MGIAGASSQPTSVQPRPDESNAATARPSRRRRSAAQARGTADRFVDGQEDRRFERAERTAPTDRQRHRGHGHVVRVSRRQGGSMTAGEQTGRTPGAPESHPRRREPPPLRLGQAAVRAQEASGSVLNVAETAVWVERGSGASDSGRAAGSNRDIGRTPPAGIAGPSERRSQGAAAGLPRAVDRWR